MNGMTKHASSFVWPVSKNTAANELWSVKDNDAESDVDFESRSSIRRALLSWGILSSATIAAEPALAARRSVFLTRSKDTTAAVKDEPIKVLAESSEISSEVCLLRLLPVKNPVFRALGDNIERVSAVRKAQNNETWTKANNAANYALELLDSKRAQLEPVFNYEDSAEVQILKGERGEQLIEAFRDTIEALVNATKARDETATFDEQRRALFALSEVGELMVKEYPYLIPKEDKFSYLPRLQGRAKVTFTFKRGRGILGNVTIEADGFAAPITAGNFVDLANRGFYTGLPIKSFKKKMGAAPSVLGFADGGFLGLDPESLEAEKNAVTVSLPVLGSFQEGFYDPLTAKPRRIPLEILRLDKKSGKPELSYSRNFFSLPSLEASIDAPKDNKPVLNFDIPGMMAFNHPDKNVNGGSAEFFSLQKDSAAAENSDLLNGQYAPFGFIIEGYDLYQSLKPGDVIDATYVSEWGILNLVKIRGTSFSDVMQSGSDETE